MKDKGPVQANAPAQSYRLLRAIIPRRLQPFARGVRKRLAREGYDSEPPFCWVYPYTQVSRRRQVAILEKTTQLIADGVRGDFVECGVLDGGTAAIMAYAARSDDRRIHLFDAWAGMPEASEQDGPGARVWVGHAVGSPARVRSALGKVGARMDRIVFHKGWFHDTFPTARVDAIAFLHIDCDFYEPTRLVLETMVPRMVPGGWVQIDDFTAFEGCRVAVEEFLAANPAYTLVVEDAPGGAIQFRT